MINIDPMVYTKVVDAVRRIAPRTYVTNVYQPVPPQFPCVFCVTADNSMFRKGRSTSTAENFAAISYRVEVYSNLMNHVEAKYEADALLAAVDAAFDEMNFTRVSCSAVPNLYDASVYRMVALYRAVVGKDHTIYRR